MEWLPGLLGVVIGGLLGGGFGWLSQRRAADQAKETRDREHERQVWARQLRYQTHAQFLSEFAVLFDAAMQADIALQQEFTPDTQPTIAMMGALNVQLTMLEMLAEPSTRQGLGRLRCAKGLHRWTVRPRARDHAAESARCTHCLVESPNPKKVA